MKLKALIALAGGIFLPLLVMLASVLPASAQPEEPEYYRIWDPVGSAALNVESSDGLGPLQLSPVQPGWWSAMWEIIPYTNCISGKTSPYIMLRNRWTQKFVSAADGAVAMVDFDPVASCARKPGSLATTWAVDVVSMDVFSGFMPNGAWGDMKLPKHISLRNLRTGLYMTVAGFQHLVELSDRPVRFEIINYDDQGTMAGLLLANLLSLPVDGETEQPRNDVDPLPDAAPTVPGSQGNLAFVPTDVQVPIRAPKSDYGLAAYLSLGVYTNAGRDPASTWVIEAAGGTGTVTGPAEVGSTQYLLRHAQFGTYLGVYQGQFVFFDSSMAKDRSSLAWNAVRWIIEPGEIGYAPQTHDSATGSGAAGGRAWHAEASWMDFRPG